MEKKPFSFILEEENETIGFQGNKVVVSKFITYPEQVAIVDNYLSNYFFPNKELMGNFVKQDYLGAEFALVLAIVDLKTNIEIKHENFDLENFINSGMWDKVKSAISNYEDFRSKLERMVRDAKEQIILEKSIGSVIDGLTSKAMILVENLGDKLSETDLNELKETANNLISELKAAPISEIFQETEKQKISKKVTKSKVH